MTAEGERLFQPMRDVAPAIIDGVGPMPAAQIGLIHNDPTDPGPVFERGRMLNVIDGDFATALLDALGPDQDVPILLVEVRHVGGATHRDVPEGSAVGGRCADYGLMLLGAPDPSLFEHVLPHVTHGILTSLAPWIVCGEQHQLRRGGRSRVVRGVLAARDPGPARRGPGHLRPERALPVRTPASLTRPIQYEVGPAAHTPGMCRFPRRRCPSPGLGWRAQHHGVSASQRVYFRAAGTSRGVEMAEHPDVTLVRRGYAAFSSGDVATLSEIIAADATQYQPGSNDMAGTHEGLEAILNFYGRLAAETDGSFQVELQHALSDGQGHVVAIQRVTGAAPGPEPRHARVTGVHDQRREGPRHSRVRGRLRRLGRVLELTLSFPRIALAGARRRGNTGASASTGRPQPAARDDSHLFVVSRVCSAPFFQPDSAGSRH